MSEPKCSNCSTVTINLFSGLCARCKIRQLVGLIETLCGDALELKAELEKHRWIHVKERLPEDSDTVFVVVQYEKEEFSLIGRYSFVKDARKWEVYPDTKLPTVTHWKPIIFPEK